MAPIGHGHWTITAIGGHNESLTRAPKSVDTQRSTVSATVRTDLVLSSLAVTHEVDAPFQHVDIASWLKTLPDHEYQRCAPGDHKACGYTTDDDGTPMSINVEMIGTSLVVQQYRFEVAEKHH